MFTIALLTGFISVALNQSALAFSIDFSGLPGFDGNGGLDFLKGPKGDTGATGPQGEQGPAGQGVEFGHLTVIVHTQDFFSGGIQSSDFTVHVGGNQQSPDTFPGSESGTEVKLGVGSYQVTEDLPDNVNAGGRHTRIQFSKDCSGVIHNNEDKTCTISNRIS